MRSTRTLLAVTPVVLLFAAAPAGAAVSHTVQPGETLWSIAAANNLTTRTVATFNGLPETSNVVLGSTIQVPTTVEGASALINSGVQLEGVPPQAGAPASSGAPASVPAASAPATSTAAPAAPSAGAPPAAGGYVVRSGDTLSGLAANSGVSVSQIAAANGLDPSHLLLTGTVLRLPSGSPTPPRASQPAPAQRVVPAAAPEPTHARVGASDIQSVAAAHGVSPSLAAAIAWQESGFNNGMVSSANARGVMQVMPGTWDFVQKNLPSRQLNPHSAADNVTAGVLYLRSLLNQTGGNESQAIAAYYQGLGALRSRGVFNDTAKYVANVQALRGRFGG